MAQTMEMEASVPPVPGTTSLTISAPTPEAKTSIFSKTGGKPIPLENVPDAHAARMKQREAARYSSINNMDKTSKLEALKSLKLNPFLIQDPHDASMNVLQRWKDMASSKEATAATPEQKKQAASNYYDKVIGPVYAQMHQKYGSGMPSKDQWMEHAYSTALKWDMDEAYDSHWKSGLYAGFKDFENMFSTGLTMLGGLLSAGTAQVRAEAGQGEGVEKQLADVKKQGVYKTMQQDAAEIPFTKHTIDSVKKASSVDGFWHDINPDLSTGQKAKSFAVELAMQLPLYAATGGITSGFLEGTGAGAIPLTQALKASNLGSTALKLLTNGAEGAMYGYTMADDADKKSESVKGAISQAILGTIFHVRGEKIKLSEASTPERAAALEEQVQKAEAAVKGWTKGDKAALTKNLTEVLRDSSLAGGRPYLGKIINMAFKHVKDTDKMSLAEEAKLVHTLYQADPAKWKHPLTIAWWIRSNMPEGKTLATLTDDEKTHLSSRLISLIKDSDALLDAGSPGEVEAATNKVAETPVGKKVAQDVGEQAYAATNKAAAEEAVRKGSRKPIEEALDIAEKRGEQVKIKGDPGRTKITTQFRGKGQNRSVSVRYQQQWISHATKQAKAAGYNNWKDWLQDLSPQDFAADVYEIYYPQSLKDAGMDHIESGNVKNLGKENPNLLAFMYNFRDRMPKEVSDRLREELIDTFKVQEGMNGRALDEPQLVRYAQGMKAHMDELLTTEKFKNPNIKGEVGNLYRSTYEDMKEPTEHQLTLHEEVIDHERNLISEMFKGKPQQAKEALTAYNLLAGARLDAFEAGEQAQRIGLHDKIDDLLVKLSKGKLDKWEY